MKYHEIPWNTMKYHEIPWNTMKYHGIIEINTYHAIIFSFQDRCPSIPYIVAGSKVLMTQRGKGHLCNVMAVAVV